MIPRFVVRLTVIDARETTEAKPEYKVDYDGEPDNEYDELFALANAAEFIARRCTWIARSLFEKK